VSFQCLSGPCHDDDFAEGQYGEALAIVKRRRGEREIRFGSGVLDSHGEAIYRDHVSAHKYPTDDW